MRHLFTPRRLLAALAVGVAGSPSVALAEPLPRFGAARPGVSDVALARSALAAVDADPALRDVNLVVSVVDRVAVVGGPVPSKELGQRAEEIVRRVTGVVDVKNRCFVQGGGGRPDPLIKAVADRLAPTGRPAVAGALPGMVSPPRRTTTPPADGAAGFAGTAVAVAPTAAAVGGPVVVRKISSGPRPSLLLDPTTAPDPAPVASTLRVTPGVPTGRPADVQTALDDVRRSDPRFAGLRVTVDRGEVVVGGTAARDADAWDFADAARRLPGVRRVVVGR